MPVVNIVQVIQGTRNQVAVRLLVHGANPRGDREETVVIPVGYRPGYLVGSKVWD